MIEEEHDGGRAVVLLEPQHQLFFGLHATTTTTASDSGRRARDSTTCRSSCGTAVSSRAGRPPSTSAAAQRQQATGPGRGGKHGEPQSTDDISSGRRGGLRSYRGPGGRTRDQLYNEAREKNVKGRSRMTKAELERAVGR
jgi:hypothetical protein